MVSAGAIAPLASQRTAGKLTAANIDSKTTARMGLPKQGRALSISRSLFEKVMEPIDSQSDFFGY